MRFRSILWIFIGFILILLIFSPCVAKEFKQEISITIFPCTDELSSFSKFNPLVTYLKEYTRLNVTLKFFKDIDSYIRAVKNNELDFVLQESLVYFQLIDRYSKDSLLRTLTWEGTGFQSGVVVVRKESDIKKIMDLKERKVMFGPKASSARWAAAKLLFKERGLDIDVDLQEYSNGGCCDDIAFNVCLKAVDAGVVCDHFLNEYSMKQKELGFDARQLVVIGKTRPVPTKVFTATLNVAPDIVDEINQALLSLDINIDAHKKILYAAELGGFLKTDAQAFDEMKTLLENMSME
jgi:phosphonate transport system substrate-binding protein